MLKGTSLRPFFVKNSYLLIIAAWLITLSFIIHNYWAGNSSLSAVQRKITQYLHNQEKDLEAMSKDTALLNRLATVHQKTPVRKDDLPLLEKLAGKKYFFFLFPVDNPVSSAQLFWNTQFVQPDVLLERADTATQGFEKLRNGQEQESNGFYVWRKIKTEKYLIIALLPVKIDYSVTNIYLENGFTANESINAGYDIYEPGVQADSVNINRIKALNGESLFAIYKRAETIGQQDNLFAVWLRIAAALLILLFVHLLAMTLIQQKGTVFGCAFLAFMIIVLRVASYFLPIPIRFSQFDLFSATIYGTNIVFPSLGDLLINTLLFIWLMLFIRQQVIEKKTFSLYRSPLLRWVTTIGGVLLLVTGTFVGGNIIKSLVVDGQIPFDVLEFSSLNSYTVFGFFALCCIAMAFFFMAQIILFFIAPVIKEKPALFFLLTAIAGLLILSLRSSRNSNFELYLLIWLLSFLFLITYRGASQIRVKLISSRLIFWLLFFSISISAILIIKVKEKEHSKRSYYARTLLNKKDRNNERLVSGMLANFRGDFLAVNFDRFKEDSLSRIIKDSLNKVNFVSYNNSFTTHIYLFDKNRKPLSNKDTASFETLNTLLSTQAKPTAEIPDLYFFDESYNQYAYISYKPIITTIDSVEKTLGHAFILASRDATVTPTAELFNKGYENSIENSPYYASAVYDNYQLISRHNDYNFTTQLQPEEVPSTPSSVENPEIRKGQNDYNELWYIAGLGKVVIIARQSKFFIESITLFSYLFCSFLLLAGLIWLLDSFIRTRMRPGKLVAYWQLTIRNQVYGTVIFISVLSFIVTGVATVLFFSNRYENNNREKISKALELIEREIKEGVEKISFADDVIRSYDSLNLPRLDSIITRVARINNADVSIYDIAGNLKVNTIKIPYDAGIISRKINPAAFYRLHTLNGSQYFEKEKIGKLEYLSCYMPVHDGKGHVYAYLNVSYYFSQQGFTQDISNFMVTMINLNAFIFLIAGIVALIIANRITRSFSFISEKMSDVNLGKMNEPIVWNRNDEIGQLVTEYNKMVSKLEDSAAALAKSEREDAWREMARQVAHEIKNPLTPMKLSLQYLQRAIAGNAPNVESLSVNVAQTLVEQIDHLSQIAGEFGQFANIGNPKKEIFDLNEALRIVTQLHATADTLHLEWKAWPQPFPVFADRTQINRLFTNLLQNAIQAVPKERTPRIVVENTRIGNNVLVMVRDNGDGIPEAMRSSIFTPNFTTKTSGTGLGLAMCKGIVEQCRGQIWFETQLGEGTTFFVELPLTNT